MKIERAPMALVSMLLATAIGCATYPPAQLVAARQAYVASSDGLSAKLTPTELHDGKKALDQANEEFERHGDTLICRDYAYIAQRKLELADVKARTELDRQKIAQAATTGVAVRDAQVKTARVALASSREQLKDERRDNNITNNDLRATNNAQTKELDAEKAARLSAEGKLAGAMKDLAAVAAVKEETRGLVITLSGSVLFASNKYALLNTAMTKLDQVAEALKAQDADKRIVVEGHTDNRGSDRINQPLSLNRAAAVRDYLVGRGVASDKISAVGMGSGKPITDNKTSENRADNRRVEIVVANATVGLR
jgi:outer membrane protein OmpA-like peptidoglycan-associated protein